MYSRQIETELTALAKSYPVVTILGPRQSGKTTLVQKVFSKKPYVNLELPDVRAFAEVDPRAFFREYPGGAVLDEIQRVPSLLSYIQDIVDRNKKPGLFILTGSHQLLLHAAITQSLAGRTALLKLLPLSLVELGGSRTSVEQLILKGFLPRVHADNLEPTRAYRNYFQTYIERDVRQLIQVKELSVFQRFIKLCAGRVGQLLNMSGLAGEVGVSSQTVQHWISILEASFIFFKLAPYFENFGKRVIKTPKIYCMDVGLLCSLLDIETETQLRHDPLRGQIFENLVVMESIKSCFNRGKESSLYYFRDHHQNEVDLIYKRGHELIPVEIKSGETFHPSFLKGVQYFQQLVAERAPKGFLIYGGMHEQAVGKVAVRSFQSVDRIFGENDCEYILQA